MRLRYALNIISRQQNLLWCNQKGGWRKKVTMGIFASIAAGQLIDHDMFIVKSRGMVSEMHPKNNYYAMGYFNEFVGKNTHLLTKEYLVEFAPYLYDIDKYFKLNPLWASDVHLIKTLSLDEKLAHTHYTTFWKEVNIANKKIRGTIDPILIDLQIIYMKQKKEFMGVLCCLPYDVQTEYMNDNDFINMYQNHFNEQDWNEITKKRKHDQRFIYQHWDQIDHNHYFYCRENYGLEQVREVISRGYIEDLECDSWGKILKAAEKTGQLNELYELCGGSIIFPVEVYNGKLFDKGVSIYISKIPGIEDISSDSFRKIINGQKICGVSPHNKTSDLIETLRKGTGLNYVDTNLTYVTNIESSLCGLLGSFAMEHNSHSHAYYTDDNDYRDKILEHIAKLDTSNRLIRDEYYIKNTIGILQHDEQYTYNRQHQHYSHNNKQ